MARLMLLGMAVGSMVAALAPLAGAVCRAEDGLHYRLHARVDPAGHRLAVEAWIRRPPSSTFYLHGGLSVRRVLADGKEVAFRRGDTAKPLPYSPTAQAVLVKAARVRELRVQYDGELTGAISGVNMVAPDLVELAVYAAWYPVFEGEASCTFEIEADLPVGFTTTTNGALKAARKEGGRTLTVWESYAPGPDIVLLASPHLHVLEGRAGSVAVEIYYSHLSPEFARSLRDGLVRGMEELARAYGPPAVRGVLRFVWSPRAGWGYSRSPLIVVSEERAQRELSKEYGQAREFHGDAHEMAHFWWLVADMSTADDWLNEGPAEYSAFRLSEAHGGPAFAQILKGEYEDHSRASQTPAAIAETAGSSPDRYVNRYEKTTLMFLEARRRFGEKTLDTMLRAFHTRFAASRNATTALFLEEVRAQMGPEAEAYFREALFRKWVVASPTQ